MFVRGRTNNRIILNDSRIVSTIYRIRQKKNPETAHVFGDSWNCIKINVNSLTLINKPGALCFIVDQFLSIGLGKYAYRFIHACHVGRVFFAPNL